jgi:hypothetical protein
MKASYIARAMRCPFGGQRASCPHPLSFSNVPQPATSDTTEATAGKSAAAIVRDDILLTPMRRSCFWHRHNSVAPDYYRQTLSVAVEKSARGFEQKKAASDVAAFACNERGSDVTLGHCLGKTGAAGIAEITNHGGSQRPATHVRYDHLRQMSRGCPAAE